MTRLTSLTASVAASLGLALAGALFMGTAQAQPHDGRGNGHYQERDGRGPDGNGPPGQRRQWERERERDQRRWERDRERDDRRYNNRYDNRPPAIYVPADRGRGIGPQRNWYRGGYVPAPYRGYSYVVNDWRGHRLVAPPRGYQWIQYGGDYLLIAVASGLIANIVINAN